MNRIQIQKIGVLTSMLLLASCGFGGKDADPLAEKNDTYVSATEKETEAEVTEDRFAKETEKYNLSIADSEAKVANLKIQMDESLANLTAEFQSKSDSATDAFNRDMQEYVDRFSDFRRQSEEVSGLQRQSIEHLQSRIQSYEFMNSEFKRLSFQGVLHSFSGRGMSPRSLVWTAGEASEYEIDIDFFDVKNRIALKNISFDKPLPDGIEYRLEGNVLKFSGTPTVEVSTSRPFVETIDLEVEVSIEDDGSASVPVLKAAEFKETLQIVVHRSEVAPEILKVKTTADAIDDSLQPILLSVTVQDASAKKDESAPVLVFSHEASAGNQKNLVVNAVPFLSLDGRSPNPKRNGDEWVYTYVFDAKKAFEAKASASLSKSVAATFNVKTFSIVSGLRSDIEPVSISLKEEK